MIGIKCMVLAELANGLTRASSSMAYLSKRWQISWPVWMQTNHFNATFSPKSAALQILWMLTSQSSLYWRLSLKHASWLKPGSRYPLEAFSLSLSLSLSLSITFSLFLSFSLSLQVVRRCHQDDRDSLGWWQDCGVGWRRKVSRFLCSLGGEVLEPRRHLKKIINSNTSYFTMPGS